MTADEALFRAPRLTRLEIQGFKSFLNRTTFAFEPGITAVVGPNGSGKSNVADAVRWVLGEQGQSALRAKKTEDVIFSGGQGRAPAGMAEATLTFDNSEGWLPTEFTEVSVTRRAFRSGENQYLINGRKVRLKDVAQLTAGLGQSHVVVGQGLVDAALSLRAEERRGLFEHAAGLAGLRLKVAEAERNLAETEANTTRLSDLLIELEPRLRQLQRAARQAQEWQGIRDRLRDLQGAHYRAALETATAALLAARQELEQSEAAVNEARGEEARLTLEAEQAGVRLELARAALAQHDAGVREIEERLRRQSHERDLAAARAESLAKRRADMDDAREGLDERVAAVTADLVRLTNDLRDLERATQESREAAARFNREKSARGQARAEIEKRVAAAERQLADCERKTGEVQRGQAVLAARGESLAAECARLAEAIAERGQRIQIMERDAAAAASVSDADVERAALIAARLEALASTLQATSQEVRQRRDDAERVQHALGDATTRLEVLRRLQESGAGLHGGVKEVMAAARRGGLSGIQGTVAELIVVPKAYETAIEVALGGRLQDVVVDRWADAEKAIAHLKQRGAGRATFQPLDTVRGGRSAGPPAEARRLSGFIGLASELVEASPEVNGIVATMLGRTIVVDDLDTTRAALNHLATGWNVVTQTGEIARSGGSVTGGSATRESGTLGRERELRDLPGAVAELEGRLAAAREAVASAEASARTVQDEQRQVEGERAAVQAGAEERRQQAARLRGWLADLRGEQERAERRWQELRESQQQAGTSQDDLKRELAALVEDRQQATNERDRAAAELGALGEAAAASERAAADEGRRLAGLEERLRGERRREANLRSQERALAEELALRAERTANLDRERASLTADHTRLTMAAEESARELEFARAARGPLHGEAAESGRAGERIADLMQRVRGTLVERDRQRDHAEFALERATREWETLRARIVEELDVSDPDEVLQIESDSADMPVDQREKAIAQLRERLRRIGYAGEDAVADFERERAHQDYLREQLADVEGAAAALRELLLDLRQTMRSRFEETVSSVAEAFAEAFSTLFRGGTARLALTMGEGNAEPGIEIIAQPPGKRLQGLALLSGGERALTAAALLLAILKVNPVPFCLLDEVDAALDEANVVRFRERLQDLARQTQVIVVTHNRATIEIADTLYGVSMGADGVSQVLSLRMNESLSAD